MQKGFYVYSIKLVKSKKVPYDIEKSITGSALAAEAARKYYGSLDREIFSVLLLDVRNRLIGANLVSIGSLTQCSVHPREVFKPAVLANAAAMIFLHNHPSGDPTPSMEDIALTRQLVQAGKLLGIQVLDHVILGESRHTSLRETGLVEFRR